MRFYVHDLQSLWLSPHILTFFRSWNFVTMDYGGGDGGNSYYDILFHSCSIPFAIIDETKNISFDCIDQFSLLRFNFNLYLTLSTLLLAFAPLLLLPFCTIQTSPWLDIVHLIPLVKSNSVVQSKQTNFDSVERIKAFKSEKGWTMRCTEQKMKFQRNLKKWWLFVSRQSERTKTKEIGLQFTDKITRMSFLYIPK